MASEDNGEYYDGDDDGHGSSPTGEYFLMILWKKSPIKFYIYLLRNWKKCL